uniref:Uncharacterized protein n=1 Tax=Lotharella oceanica TaxID=641309 RepID=A0A7S2U2K2_9EUKA|mmetsp:Transcript_7509/g.14672  ORF Transcript_7509/g.14672 Transcript_7509/m.14672 type:complete len:218 (+) Transcript_7509:143-796(+)
MGVCGTKDEPPQKDRNLHVEDNPNETKRPKYTVLVCGAGQCGKHEFLRELAINAGNWEAGQTHVLLVDRHTEITLVDGAVASSLASVDDVDYVLFFVSLAEYDKRCEEDRTKSRMTMNVHLFKGRISLFEGKPIVLVFNHWDEFVKKINAGTLLPFDDYEDGKDPEKAYEYIQNTFTSLRDDPPLLAYKMDSRQINVWEVIKSEMLPFQFDDSELMN